MSAVALVGTASLVVLPAGAQPEGAHGESDLEVYVGEVDAAGVEVLRGLGVEVVLSEGQAAKVRDAGVDLEVKTVDGVAASQALRLQAAAGWDAFRSYSEPGGIKDEVWAAAGEHTSIAKPVVLGESVNGQEILGLKVTKDANRLKDGKRPAVLYASAQHAREWITPEMTRRLMHHVLDGYGTDPEITELVDTTELWFVPVLNPDGYDFTFTEGNRLWRKNLRDNNGDGEITLGDGVDLNRNFSTKWGYDNEGSSTDPASDTYRGSGPNSEPETQALDNLFKRMEFEFFINYHSAAELLLYGIGWQVSTPSPDDVIYQAMVGTDENPAVPGYDPDISAELYTTNGDTDTHATVRYGTLGFTPEMSTCTAASNSVPDDEWFAEDCVSDFIFPDDEELIQAEFEKNIPFALSVAKSTHDPDDPVSALGLDAPDLVADPFDVSFGRNQQVAVTAKRSLRNLKVNYSINGARTRTSPVREWDGGERYGDTHDDYYGEFRATIRANAGDEVAVWFSGRNVGRGPGSGVVSTEPFTYTVHDDIGGDVLILAAEDVTGISPAQGLTSAQFVDEYASSIEAAGHSSDVYDFDVMGRQAPHHLGVLSHYDAVVWETGEDIILRSVGQVAGTTAKASLDIEVAVRDYLNEGGKLMAAGKYNQFAQAANGAYFYNPFQPPECTTPGAYPCLPVLNDFQQYWLGAYVNISDGGTDDTGEPFGLVGVEPPFDAFTGDLNAPGSAENQDHTALLLTTSSFLPPDEFPQFASNAPLGGTSQADRSTPARASGTSTASRPTWPTSGSAPLSTCRRRRPESSTSGPRTTPRRSGTSCSSRRTRSEATSGRHCPTPTATPHRRPARAARPGGWISCTRSWPTTWTRPALPPAPRVSGTRPRARPTAGPSGRSTCPATPVRRSRFRLPTRRTGRSRTPASSSTTSPFSSTAQPSPRPGSRTASATGPSRVRRKARSTTPTTGCAPSSASRKVR
jgi:hypothetical protein